MTCLSNTLSRDVMKIVNHDAFLPMLLRWSSATMRATRAMISLKTLMLLFRFILRPMNPPNLLVFVSCHSLLSIPHLLHLCLWLYVKKQCDMFPSPLIRKLVRYHHVVYYLCSLMLTKFSFFKNPTTDKSTTTQGIGTCGPNSLIFQTPVSNVKINEGIETQTFLTVLHTPIKKLKKNPLNSWVSGNKRFCHMMSLPTFCVSGPQESTFDTISSLFTCLPPPLRKVEKYQ